MHMMYDFDTFCNEVIDEILFLAKKSEGNICC